MILLDASVLLAAYGRKSPRGNDSPAAATLRRMIESGMALGIPAIVLQEVLAGVRDKTQLHELHAHLSAFRILPATVADHVKAAQLAAACGEKRMPCSTAAALIVAQASHGGWQLYTLNSELTAVAKLGCVSLIETHKTASDGRRRS